MSTAGPAPAVAAPPLALPAPTTALSPQVTSLKSFVGTATTASGSSWWWLKYVIVFAVIGLLLMVLLVFLAQKYGNIDLAKLVAVATGTVPVTEPTTASTATTDKAQPKEKSAVQELEDYIDQQDQDTPDEPLPDDAGSRTQASKAKSKAGYCYIGEDRGFRSCIQVGDNDKCMSGDIFPTMDVCINPALRA